MLNILISLFLTINPIFSDFERMEKEISQYQNVNQLFEFVSKEEPPAKWLSREIGNGFVQEEIGFEMKEYGGYFNFSYVSIENKLVYGNLTQSKKRKKEAKIIYDIVLIQEYVNYFNEHFGTDKNVNDFENELYSIDMFSSACGYGGVPFPEWIKMEEFVKKSDTGELIGLLKSFNVESKAYGIVGFYKLKNNGYKLTVEHEYLIDKILKQNSAVNVCLGCSPGEKISMKKLIKIYK